MNFLDERSRLRGVEHFEAMYFHFNTKSTSLLIFFFQGLVFAFLLFRSFLRTRQPADRWLSLLVLLAALYLAPFLFGYAGWYGREPYRSLLFYVPFQQHLLLPPVLYFYVRSMVRPGTAWRRRSWLHFLPAALYGLYSLLVFAVDQWAAGKPYFYSDGRDKDLSPAYQLAGFCSLVLYLALSFRCYRRYRRTIPQQISWADAVRYSWIDRFLLATLALILLRIGLQLLNPEWAQFGAKYWYYICFALLFYYISFQGYVHAGRFEYGMNVQPPVPEQMGEGTEEPESEPEGETPVMEDLEYWKAQVEEAMRAGRLWEAPLLSLQQMALHLRIPAKKLSAVINQGFGLNFNDYINRFRVEAVIEKLQAGETSLQTLLAIALDCGFNSKSTFNRAFRKHTGLSPREFLKQRGGK